MKRLMYVAVLALVPGLAMAQTSATPSGASEARSTASTGTGRGAEIRIERPDLSIFVRCGEGENARSCADTATQLIEKLATMPAAERRDRRGERDMSRGEDRRPRDRD